MGGIFRHMVYCCLSSIPTTNEEGCLRTYQERVSPNGSAVCFPTTGTAHWVRHSLGHPFLLSLLHPPTQVDSLWEGTSLSSASLATWQSFWPRSSVENVILSQRSHSSLVPNPARYKVDMVFIDLKVVETLVGIGELNSSSLQEWYALLMAEPSLQSQHDC